MNDGLNRTRLIITRALPVPAMVLARRRFTVWANPADATMTGAQIRERAEAHAAEVLLVMAMDKIDRPLIAALPDSVRIIATYSVGHNHIDLAAASERGIAVLSTPDVLSDSVAEIAILLMLGAARRAHEGSTLLYSGRWTGWSPTQLLGRDITGARLGVFGMGRIGRTIARRAARGFDMKIHYHNRSRLPPEAEEGATYHGSAESLLEASEFLMLAAPSTPETRGFLNAQRIARLPKGAIVANVARGDLVEDAALIAALRSGHLAAAGLDVFNNEPAIAPEYLRLPNVFLQPHQGSSTLGTRLRMAELLFASIEALLAGQPTANRLT